jgi:hypothetical protein
MKLAIMQPYFFPYLGYFQLINAVDKFVIYDDVNYINKGWINRNNILVNGKAHMIQVPLIGASQNRLINEIEILDDEKWKIKLLRTIRQSYSQAPFFVPVFAMIEAVINSEKKKISELNAEGIIAVCKYLDINTEIVSSSVRYDNKHLKGQDRILDICVKEKATTYINPSGGKELYDRETFLHKGVDLQFLNPKIAIYSQFKSEFIPWLSIIDLMMHLDIKELENHLEQFQLTTQ